MITSDGMLKACSPDHTRFAVVQLPTGLASKGLTELELPRPQNPPDAVDRANIPFIVGRRGPRGNPAPNKDQALCSPCDLAQQLDEFSRFDGVQEMCVELDRRARCPFRGLPGQETQSVISERHQNAPMHNPIWVGVFRFGEKPVDPLAANVFCPGHA